MKKIIFVFLLFMWAITLSAQVVDTACVKIFNGGDEDITNAITVDVSDNVYITGTSLGSETSFSYVTKRKILPDSIPFATVVNYEVGDSPQSIFCADLDGDIDMDLVVTNAFSSNISILMNNGDGTFQARVDYDANYGASSVFCADLDGDIDLDLAVANWSWLVSVLKNNGNGTFQTKVDYDVGAYPTSVFCADLDGDTALDLSVANFDTNNVSVLKNNGNGTFQTKVDYDVGSSPRSVFCGDLDGDTDIDLAVANFDSDNVSILLNNGNGTFQTKVDYVAGVGAASVFCADLDGDTDLDLAVANYRGHSVSILKNNGNGTFQIKVDYDAGSYPTSVFCADMDGDTDLDLSVANGFSQNVSILKNNGNGTFQTKVDYDVLNWPTSVFCADLDGDTDLDLAVVNDSVSILKNLTVNFISDTMWFFAYSPVDIIVTDPNLDSIGVDFNTIPEATYDTTQDINEDGENDDVVTIPKPLIGEYTVRVVAEPGSEGGSYTLSVKLDGNDDTPIVNNISAPGPSEVDTFYYPVFEYLRGDANSDGETSISDVIYTINYLFKGGDPPDPSLLGDANCCKEGDGNCDVVEISVSDVIYLINYLFKGGTAPCS